MEAIRHLQRRYLTLIEMIVVMAIIVLAAGVIGINISKAMQEQRFRTEIALVLDKLRLAQNLMLILNEDIKVEFKKTPRGLQLNLKLQCALDKGWNRELTRESQPLTAIQTFQFKGQGQQISKDEFTIDFLSTGMVMSSGVLVLAGANDTRTICLHGYPHPISATEDPSKCNPETEKRNYEQLTQYIMPEIISKYKEATKSRTNPPPK